MSRGAAEKKEHMKNKILCIVAFIVILGAALQAQQPHSEDYDVGNVRRLLKHSFRSGTDDKFVARAGDRMGIALAKALSPSDVSDPKTVRRAIELIRQAFEAPTTIAIAVDRKPSVTLLLLDHLRSSTEDASLRQEVQATIESLRKYEATNTDTP